MIYIEGTCVCGFGPLRAERDDANPSWIVKRVPTGTVATKCPTCNRPLAGDQLLPLGSLMLVDDADLSVFAALLEHHIERVTTVADKPGTSSQVVDGARNIRASWAHVRAEQARRGAIRGPVDVDPRLVLARALGDARRALSRASRPGDEGIDCPSALAVLVAAITDPAR